MSSSISISPNSSERRDTKLLSALGSHHHKSASSVIERRCISGGDGSVFFESSSQISEFSLVESSVLFVHGNGFVWLSALSRDDDLNLRLTLVEKGANKLFS